MRVSPKEVLAFDTEVAPRWWWYDGKCTNRLMMFVGEWVAENSLGAFGWILLPDVIMDSPSLRRRYGGLPIERRRTGLDLIRRTIEDADTLIGHNLSGFDIGTINGELKISNEPLLPPRTVIDTLTGARSTTGQAMSLANRLSRLPGNTIHKPHVDPVVWEAAFNDFDPLALREVWSRAATDVLGHIILNYNDAEKGYLTV